MSVTSTQEGFVLTGETEKGERQRGREEGRAGREEASTDRDVFREQQTVAGWRVSWRRQACGCQGDE